MIAINGHFKSQPVTGVQRYALEMTREFDAIGFPYRWVDPPDRLQSDALRQLWMQGFMTGRAPDDLPLWSPTNTGPISHPNQILTLHDLADQLHPEWFSRKYTAWRAMILPPLLRRVKQIITISEYSRQTILERYPFTEGKVEVIYHGVNGDHFCRRPDEEVGAITGELGIEKRYVITVGSLDPRKNINGLIRAWNRLPQQIREERDLVIVGGASDKFAFALEEVPDDSIRFPGYIPNERLPALYSGADLFVLPSLFEGFGLPVLEAMACGVPVLTSNTTSLKELAEGKAVTVDPSSTAEIAEGIQQLLESPDLRSRYIERGETYARQFSWKDAARKTVDIMRRFI